jgi:hypothetical protein
VSANAKKGYSAEHAVEALLTDRGYSVYRPRAGRQRDTGDLAGLPTVISVKNHVTLHLAEWVGDLESMVVAANVGTGVLWHKRRGKGDPRDWYVTTSGRLFLPLLGEYCRARKFSEIVR